MRRRSRLATAWPSPSRRSASRSPATTTAACRDRPSPGRVTRGTVANLWSQLSVQGPMARNVADLALFLDTMAGFCPLDPLTFDAPAVSFSDGVAQPVAPKRVAFTGDYNGRMPRSAVARPRDARHRRQSLEPALGAGADGAQCRRSGAVPRHDGGLLPARPADLRCAGGLV